MLSDRVDRFVQAWGRNGLALVVCFLIASTIVRGVYLAGWIYTTGPHIAWVTVGLFLSVLAWKDSRSVDAESVQSEARLSGEAPRG